MALHVFVAMPCGHQQDIDFDAVHLEYLKSAREGARFVVFRSNEERRSGGIRADMFQGMLLAELVVVDLTLDNTNVWFDLGKRHALLARCTPLIKSERDFQAFDIYTERELSYHFNDMRPDPRHLQDDRQSLASKTLMQIRQYQLAIEQSEAALQLDPADLGNLRKKASCLHFWVAKTRRANGPMPSSVNTVMNPKTGACSAVWNSRRGYGAGTKSSPITKQMPTPPLTQAATWSQCARRQDSTGNAASPSGMARAPPARWHRE